MRLLHRLKEPIKPSYFLGLKEEKKMPDFLSPNEVALLKAVDESNGKCPILHFFFQHPSTHPSVRTGITNLSFHLPLPTLCYLLSYKVPSFANLSGHFSLQKAPYANFFLFIKFS